MHKTLTLPALVLLTLPALTGCNKIQARAELKKGNELYRNEQYTDALKEFQLALQQDPDATFAWRSVGLSALALYRPGDDNPRNVGYATTAIDAFEKYLADYPDDEKVSDYLMTTYVNAKKYDDALAFIDRRIQEKPAEAAKLQRTKITIMTQAGRLDQAFQLANSLQGEEKAQTLFAIGASAWDRVFHQGETLDYEGRAKLVDMGLDAVKKALDIQPDFANAMVYYGLLYRQKAALETDPAKRLEDEQIASDWQQKAQALINKSKPAKAPANT